MADMQGETPELTERERSAARSRATAVSPGLRARFDERLASWKATWAGPALMLSSDTRDYTRGPEFEAILELGPDALPLVVEQIAHEEDGFFLLAVLENWQARADLVETTAEYPLESQQSRARRAAREILASG